MPRVLNQSTATPEELKDAIYVGRPTKWGNPFKIGDSWGVVRKATREDVIRYYSVWLTVEHPELAEAARRELRGKDLVCWCAPKPCHADILLAIVNADPLPPV